VRIAGFLRRPNCPRSPKTRASARVASNPLQWLSGEEGDQAADDRLSQDSKTPCSTSVSRDLGPGTSRSKSSHQGEGQVQVLCKSDLVRSLCLLIPERGRLAQHMASNEPLSPEAMWAATDDLRALYSLDLSVLYLPGHQPIEGRCPVKCCQLKLDRCLSWGPLFVCCRTDNR
jgi:hypothetical protein